MDFVLGAAFVALLILCALSVAFFLTAILGCHRAHACKPLTSAEQKVLALLREWLSPDQRARFESYRHFEVTGSRTGKRYRIRHSRVVNIDEIDERTVWRIWSSRPTSCVMPTSPRVDAWQARLSW